MTAIVLQPAGDAASHKHYFDTIASPVSLLRMQKHLPAADYERLSTIYPDGHIPVWGVTPGKVGQNAKKWGRLEVGDVTLFARKGMIFASGVMTHKVHSEELAVELWNRKEDGSTWEYVYFLDEITNHDFPVRELNLIAGYKENNVVQGFNVLDEEKSDAVLAHFDLESSVYFPEVQEEEYLDTLQDEATLDESTQTVRRKEQGFLRRNLFGTNATGMCCMCGRTYPVTFLVTAHIKKRSECTLEERKDYRNVVAPMCKFGCDELYEKRYVYVEDGIVRLNSKKSNTGDLEVVIRELEGNRCKAWSEGNRAYFDWHRCQAVGH